MKLLIVDDAVQICTGIRDSIDWKKQGIEAVFTANDGQEGWEIFLLHQPEVVIADIRMAGLNGLELSRKMLEHSPATRIILLSAYSEFEYARAGLEIGVFAYELKPLKIERLVNRVKEAAAAWEVYARRNNALTRYDDLCRRQMVNDLISGTGGDRTDAHSLAGSFGLDPDKPYCCVVIRTTEDIQMTEPMLALLNQYSGACIRKEDKEIVLLLESAGTHLHQETLIVQLRSMMMLSYSQTGKAGVSSSMRLNKVPVLYRQACQALEHCFFTGPGSLNRYIHAEADSQDGTQASSVSLFPGSGDGLWDRQVVEKSISDLYSNISTRCQGNTPRSVHALTLELLRELRLSLTSVTGEEEPYLTAIIHDMTGAAPYPWIQSYLVLLLSAYTDVYDRYCGNDPQSNFIIRCKYYIGSHYQENLRVQDMATYFRVTPNYFSHLFKKNMGISFKNYLNRVRIEQANRLLKQGRYTAAEIAQMVGFLDYKYFHQVYRKYMNCAPTHQG